MTASKSLPPRPSLDSLRKQAKKLARDRSLSLRDAQLALAREYGYPGWQDLTAEVHKRLGNHVEWAAAQARRIIHDNDVERLKQLLADHPALLSWRADSASDGSAQDDGGEHEDDERDGAAGLVGFATGSYGDSFDPVAEEHFTRAACAELLIDAGAVVMPSVCDGLLRARARGLLQLFRRKGLLPHTLKFLAALNDIDAIRTALEHEENLTVVAEAFTVACGFQHEAVAALLLDRAIALDPEIAAHVDGSDAESAAERVGRQAFITYFIENRPGNAIEVGLWKAFVMEHVSRALYSWSGGEASLVEPRGQSDLAAFVALLDREAWLLGEDFVAFQEGIIARAALKGSGEFITALLDRDPAILRRQPPPRSQAIEYAFTYAHLDVVPLLTRIWPLPDDLPHAAGLGDLARVQRWFDESGAPALGDVDHYPASPYMQPGRVEEYAHQWAAPGAQRVLDAALAWSVINSHFEVAAFLLDHGANVNTSWSSHEPASILHELVWHRNYAAMQFLIDRGIDMTIKDYRWNATAAGWARYAAHDEQLAQWLEEAARKRGDVP